MLIVMTSSTVGKFLYSQVKNFVFSSSFYALRKWSELKSDEITMKDNRLNFLLIPSKSWLSLSITEIITLKDKHFSQIFRLKTWKFAKLIDSKLSKLVLKLTQAMKFARWNCGLGLVSYPSIEIFCHYDVINRGKIFIVLYIKRHILKLILRP